MTWNCALYMQTIKNMFCNSYEQALLQVHNPTYWPHLTLFFLKECHSSITIIRMVLHILFISNIPKNNATLLQILIYSLLDRSTDNFARSPQVLAKPKRNMIRMQAMNNWKSLTIIFCEIGNEIHLRR